MHYYTEDGQIFTSKLKAIQYSKMNNRQLNFYYCDDFYSQLNWKIEPTQSLPQLYKEQAQRIRDNYDYVILAYSGGQDSTNILETFYYNNIKLDKILVVGAFSQDSYSGVDENHNGELYHNAFPYLKDLGLENITQVCDYTEYFDKIDNFTITKYHNEWVDFIGPWFSPHHWFWRDMEKFVVPSNFQNKRVATIFGIDKPILDYDHERGPAGKSVLTGFRFRDTACCDYGQYDKQTEKSNYDRINFYWDPNFPQILIKQLHVIKRVYDIEYTNSYDPVIGSQYLSGMSTDQIVYDLKRPLSFKSPKSKTNIISLRDNYLMNKKDSRVYSIFSSGLERIYKTIDRNTLTTVTSKFYRIV